MGAIWLIMMCFLGYVSLACPLNCGQCQNISNVLTCLACKPQFYLFNQTCPACIGPCNLCINSTFCISCQQAQNRGLNIPIGKCEPCSQVQCLECLSNKYFCNHCDYGYGTNDDGLCKQCSHDIAQCSDCDRLDKCYHCHNQYGVQFIPPLDYQICIRCQDVNCAHCGFNFQECTYCHYFYGLDEVGKCELCLDSQCLICSQNKYECIRCIENGDYGFNEHRDCVLCGQLCLTCSYENYVSCLSCLQGRFVSNNSCFPCSLSCQTCVNSSAYCTSCAQGKFVLRYSGYSQCRLCPLFCTKCTPTSNFNNSICTQCSHEGQFYTSNPKRCREICGDSYTEHHVCDNEIGVPLDGCDDDCHVMPGFACEVDQNGKTSCYYNGALNLDVVNWEIVQTENRFTLKTKLLHPLLHTFFILSPSELIFLFKFVNLDIVLTSVIFDPVTHQFTFEANYFEDLVFDTIDIAFIQPNLDNKISVLDVNFGKELPFYYSNFMLLFSTNLFILCWLICTLGWIGFILGLIMKSLQGIEAMWVLQLSWFILLWSNFPIMRPFRQFLPLRFSSFYNYPVSPINEYHDSPQNSYFKLNPVSFFNSLNCSVICLLIPFILVIVTKLRLHFISIKLQHNTEEIQTYNKAQKSFEVSMQILMSFCMINFIHLCQFMVIHFQQQSFKLDILSILALAISIFIILFAFYHFFVCPDSFGYFRYSFKLHFFAVNHYFIHPIIIITTVCLLGLLTNVPWAPVIPCALMILYTLFYQPYFHRWDNYRSCFNYLTILSFFATKIIIESLSPKSDNFHLYVYLSMGLSVASILIVVILGNAFTIFQFLFENIRKIEEMISISENSGKMKILNDLVADDVDKKMKDKQIKTALNIAVPVSISVRKYSNDLKSEPIENGLLSTCFRLASGLKEQNEITKEHQKLKENTKEFKKQRNQKKNSQKSPHLQYSFEMANFQCFEVDDANEGKQQTQKMLLKKEVSQEQPIHLNELNEPEAVRKVLLQENTFINFVSSVNLSKGFIEQIQNGQENAFVKIYEMI